ncbi:PREDICTED: venom carboxylesterase-6-like isoform X2 [Nicrophorus vespilloides]|uniref:Carboxylic ester hydrolase n=1 Tax=Nicrophorus vespilloides TaxID=110193 RepID=A0ABM1NAQ9_NICVS|nr:PREDICTED: venom carboxylesterase-6-like isoform X2 [Nicrophorus vespilloides]
MWLPLLLASAIAASDESLIVITHNGKIQGKYMPINSGKEIRAFLGVRYAKPPIGELRFMPPQPLEKLQGVQMATTIHASCPQVITYIPGSQFEGEEDCLYLNVYAPKVSNKLLPVMVYIHGGGFLFGGGNTLTHGPDKLLDEEIVLVVINYRLGPLGFLSTADEVVPGNNGLKDQTMSLRWVQEHIQYFGGDPTQVTIFGESAGGASTHFHVISSLSKGLFQTSISQSGSAFCPWALSSPREAYDLGRKIAKLLECPTESSEEMVKCLKTIDVKRFFQVQAQFLHWDVDPLTIFVPVIEIDHDGAFISKHPENIIKSGEVNRVTWITGLTKDEGAIRCCGIVGRGRFDEFKRDFDKITPASLFYKGRVSSEKTYTKKIRDFYFKKEFSVQQTTHMYTDGLILMSLQKALNLHRKYSKIPLYFYLFNYSGSMTFTEIFGDKDNDYGVCHADELIYLFPYEDVFFGGRKPSENDVLMTKTLTKLWTNFAKYKQPTVSDSNWSHAQWEPVQTDSNEYFYIGGPDEFKMDANMFPERVQFWNELQASSEYKDEL